MGIDRMKARLRQPGRYDNMFAQILADSYLAITYVDSVICFAAAQLRCYAKLVNSCITHDNVGSRSLSYPLIAPIV